MKEEVIKIRKHTFIKRAVATMLALTMMVGMGTTVFAEEGEAPVALSIRADAGYYIFSQTEEDIEDGLTIITVVQEPIVKAAGTASKTIVEHCVKMEGDQVVKIYGSFYIGANFTYDSSSNSISMDFYHYNFSEPDSTMTLLKESHEFLGTETFGGKHYAKYTITYSLKSPPFGTKNRTMYIKCNSDGVITNSKDNNLYTM